MPELDWKHEPLAESFRAFKAKMTLYLEDKEVENPVKQAIKIKIAIGGEGVRRLMASGLDDAKLKMPHHLWKLFEEQLDASVQIKYRSIAWNSPTCGRNWIRQSLTTLHICVRKQLSVSLARLN